MEVRNLDDVNLERLKACVQVMQEDSPEIEYEIFNQDAKGKPIEKTVHQRLDEMAEAIANIQIKIEHIFSKHVLMDGKFVDTKKFEAGRKDF